MRARFGSTIGWLLFTTSYCGTTLASTEVTPASPSEAVSAPVSVETCVSATALTADSSLTLGELRRLCEQMLVAEPAPSIATQEVAIPPSDKSGVLHDRLVMEALNRSSRFTLNPHKRNFLMPAVYHEHPNVEPYIEADSNLQHQRKLEAEIQLSVKILMRENIFGNNGHLYFAYTSYSLWQAYSREDSAPFRGTDHMPEAFISFYNDWEIFGFRNTVNSIGINHQSNGQGGTLSRSWNRILATSVFERGNLVLSLSPYYRIPESEKKHPFDKSGDDNPDIEKYMGSGELGIAYKIDEKILTLTTRNLFENSDYATYDVSLSFPISTNIRGLMRYFNGYGYSLIDHDTKQNAFGIGILFTDFF